MSSEDPKDRPPGRLLILPLWGLFLCSAVIAWQLTELNSKVQTLDWRLQSQQQHLFNIAVAVANKPAVDPNVAGGISRLAEELKWIREGLQKSGVPKAGKP